MSEERVLHSVGLFGGQCRHNKFKVDMKLGYVECGICGEKLNPMWVLHHLCNEEARAWQQLEALKKKIEKHREKLRCKCNHCNKMTNIYRR